MHSESKFKTMKDAELFEFLVETGQAEQEEELRRKELIDSILTPEQRAQIEDINAEIDGSLKHLRANRETCENELKGRTLSAGVSLSHGPHKAIYNKPRVTWDNKGLEGFALLIPELKNLRKEGEPFVSIRLSK